ncbi:HNH endonuclease [Comamonas testosteroni]|uniref:HNH endonuclease n=1 Tax=Comamonas testosteroni TaxID=285 RepID=UPI00389AFBF8
MGGKASVELYPGQRQKERRQLFSRFAIPAVEAVYREKFFALFGTRCFKCGQPETYVQGTRGLKVLCIDHHVPMAHGGHLVPGNLVSLCRRCNGTKLDQDPEAFYTAEELSRLQPFLDRQHELFNFVFDWDAWRADPAGYLIGLGVSPTLVGQLLHDEDHPDFLGMPEKDHDASMSVPIGLPPELAKLFEPDPSA